MQRLQAPGRQLLGRLPRDRLDATQPGADARLAGDPEAADLPGRRDMGSTAQLLAEAVDLDHPDRIGQVFLAEEHVGAQRLGVGQAHLGGNHSGIAAHLLIHDPLDLAQRCARRCGRRGKVESQPIGTDPTAGLLCLLAQHVAQGAVQEMGGRVVACRAPASIGVDAGCDRFSDRQLPLEPTHVHDRVPHALRVIDEQAAVLADQLAAIADLPAALGIERRPVEHHLRRCLTLRDGEHRGAIGLDLVRVADELAL